MQQPTNTLDRLLITAGAPPEEWLRASTAVRITAVILSFWETTVSLIENEWFLGRDQRRFLAMVRDHKERFELLRGMTNGGLVEVPETAYLHSKLDTSPQPVPTFDRAKFRSLADDDARQGELPTIDNGKEIDKLLAADVDLEVIAGHLLRLGRAIAELEIARSVIGQASMAVQEREGEWDE